MNMILFEESLHDNVIPMQDERAKHILNILKLKNGDTFRMGIVNESEGTARGNSRGIPRGMQAQAVSRHASVRAGEANMHEENSA